MTYDYSRPDSPGPNAPMDWIEENVLRLCPDFDPDRRSQILVGLNLYGNIYGPAKGTGDSVIGPRYLDHLREHGDSVVFRWDPEYEEHEVVSDYAGTSVWYPTLKSLDARIELADSLGCGMALWEIGQGLDYFYNLF
ncbi:Chitinase domain-containing protein 1 [Cladochytrium tenue]|nr:Chitinase domain-containing protein 1 [Cladochytrium tenue]